METTLRRLQLTQLEILKTVDSVCRKNNINYSLYAGTMLGAVRHGGFIPWDDDIDICMERSEYDRFIAAWESDPPAGFLLQNKENTPAFTQSFTKIRKEHTTFLQDVEEIGRYPTGIFLDVFPIDRIPENKTAVFAYKAKCAVFLLLTREFVPEKSGLLSKALAFSLLKSLKPEKRFSLRERLLHSLTRYDDDHSLRMLGFDTLNGLDQLYPPDFLDHYSSIEFEGYMFPCCCKWKDQLEILYGDYMTLPPEKERTWKHHPIILDFERDYEEIKGERP